MLTKSHAHRIRSGITAGRAQAAFERMYSRGGPHRFSLPGALNAQDAAPTNFPAFVAYWRTLGRTPSTPRPF